MVDAIGPGFLVLLAVDQENTPARAAWLAEKIAGLWVFPGADDKLKLSLTEIGGACLVVSQSTLWGDCAKDRRPSFARAAKGDKAEPLYEAFVQRLRGLGLPVATDSFGAMMDIHLVNQGPVTLLLDTASVSRPPALRPA